MNQLHTGLRGILLAASAVALMSTAACNTVGGNHEIGPITTSELPYQQKLSDGPPSQEGVARYEKIVARCNYIVTSIRGTPMQAGIRRGSISVVTGGAGGALGGVGYNAVTTGAKYSIPGLSAMYALVSGPGRVADWAISYRDQNYSIVLTCARDAQVDNIVWYAPAEVEDPAARAALASAFEKGKLDPGFWPDVPNTK
jgi:hypothetical protein